MKQSLLSSVLFVSALLYGYGVAKGLAYLAAARHVDQIGGLEYYLAFLVMLPWAMALPLILSRAAGLTIACIGAVTFLAGLTIPNAPLEYWFIACCFAVLNILPLVGLYLISDYAVSRRRMNA